MDELLDEIFDGKKPLLYFEFERWVRDSRRFKAFAVTYRTKLKAKLKNARDEPSLNDLRAEWETAALLLHADPFTIEYEKYAATKQRAPDFTVTYKTHTPFNIEVRRLRNVELAERGTETRVAKLMAVLCDKVGQMPPGIINLLWLNSERAIAQTEIASAVTTLHQMARPKPEGAELSHTFLRAADFHNHSHRLSGVVLRHGAELTLWQNPLARHRTPTEIVNVLQRTANRELGQGSK